MRAGLAVLAWAALLGMGGAAYANAHLLDNSNNRGAHNNDPRADHVCLQTPGDSKPPSSQIALSIVTGEHAARNPQNASCQPATMPARTAGQNTAVANTHTKRNAARKIIVLLPEPASAAALIVGLAIVMVIRTRRRSDKAHRSQQ